MKSRLLAAIICVSLLCGTAYAHHSFAGTYILDQRATIEGTLVSFVIQNPHSFVTVDVKGADGKIRTWAVEWGGVTQLTQTGVTAATLKVGDKISVTGAPAKATDELKVLMRKIERPTDGWSWEGETGSRYGFASSAEPAAK